VYLEAALAGLPLVLIDKELSEVIEPGVNGEYARNNPTNLANVLIDLLSHPKRREAYGKASQSLARRFTERRQVDKLIKFYDQIVGEYEPR